MSWIKELLKSTEETESPVRFYYWSALCAISAVVKNNVYLDKFTYKLYPNIYVFLVARSGLRKGVPVQLAKKLVMEAKCTRVIVGRGSIQGIIKEMGNVYTLPDGSIIKDSSAFLCSGEFSSFLIRDPDALTILTDLYDTHFVEDWKNTLRNSPIDKLTNVCVTILGAMNENHLPDIIRTQDVTGGMIARTFVVHEELRHGKNPLTERPKNLADVKLLGTYLKVLSNIKGEFKYSEDAKKFYEDWYDKHISFNHKDSTGALERIHDGILKVAMLLSLSRSPGLCLELEDIKEAVDQCFDCLIGMKRVVLGIGKGEFSEKTRIVLADLLKAPDNEISRQRLLSNHHGDFDAIDLDRIVESLVQSGAVGVERRGNVLFYKMPPKVVEMYTKFKSGG